MTRTACTASGFIRLLRDGVTVVDGRCDEVNWELVRRKLLHKIRRAFGAANYRPHASIGLCGCGYS